MYLYKGKRLLISVDYKYLLPRDEWDAILLGIVLRRNTSDSLTGFVYLWFWAIKLRVRYRSTIPTLNQTTDETPSLPQQNQIQIQTQRTGTESN